MEENEIANLGVALWSDPLLATIEERHVLFDIAFPKDVDEILDLSQTPEANRSPEAFDRIEH